MPPPRDDKRAPFVANRILLKAKYSFYSALVFFLFANPETFAVIQRVIGGAFHTISSSGAPTFNGLLLHTGLFFLTMLGLMLLPSE
jgi:hypothetical protein